MEALTTKSQEPVLLVRRYKVIMEVLALHHRLTPVAVAAALVLLVLLEQDLFRVQAAQVENGRLVAAHIMPVVVAVV